MIGASLPPANIASARPSRIASSASPIAMFEAAQAVDWLISGPFVPSSIETQPAPMLGMMRRDRERAHAVGAAVPQHVVAVLERVQAADAGRDRRADALGSAATSTPESSSAWRAAASTICAKRSIRRADLRSIQSVGSKSFSSHAKWTG